MTKIFHVELDQEQIDELMSQELAKQCEQCLSTISSIIIKENSCFDLTDEHVNDLQNALELYPALRKVLEFYSV